MTWFVLTLLGAFIQVVVAELLGWADRLAQRMISRAARGFPECSRSRYENEWLAELEAFPGLGISKMIFAFRVWIGARETRLALNADSPSSRRSDLVAKRALDVILSAIALVLVAPLWLAIAVGIKLESPGTVMFRQTRIGRGGTHFTIRKFRTVMPNGELSKVGAFLRRNALDELPQMINVLRGDMSLVGPRPIRPEYVDHVPREHADRFSVRPVSCWKTSPWMMAMTVGAIRNTPVRPRSGATSRR